MWVIGKDGVVCWAAQAATPTVIRPPETLEQDGVNQAPADR